MMLSNLMEGATLAADLSASRRKGIALTLVREGIAIEGVYRDAMGAIGYRHNFLVGWPDFDGNPVNPLTQAIRLISRELDEHWRNDGMPG